MIPKPKRKKKPSRKSLVAKLDKVFSLYIRSRDKECVICHAKENLTCGHLFSRGHHSTRWMKLNAHCQCTGCNYLHEYDTYPYTRYFIKRYGIEEYDRLHAVYATVQKYKTYDLEVTIEYYTDLLNRLKEQS